MHSVLTLGLYLSQYHLFNPENGTIRYHIPEVGHDKETMHAVLSEP